MGKKTKVALAIATASAAVWAGTKAMAKPQKREYKEILQGTPLVVAHLGGAHIAPEHSLEAFAKSHQYGVNGYFINLRLTKDEEIVAFTDETVDRTSDAIGFVKDYTLEELKQFNFGAHFESLEGEYPYKDQHVKIVTLREILEKYADKQFILNIMDRPDTYEGSLIPSKLWRLIEELYLSEQVIVTSPYDEQTDRFNLYAQNSVALGVSDSEITKAYTAFTSQFGHLYNPKGDTFVVPLKTNVINFESPKFVHFLNDLNVKIIYTKVNDLVAMNRVIRNRAAGIITDRPDLAKPLLQKLKTQ